LFPPDRLTPHEKAGYEGYEWVGEKEKKPLASVPPRQFRLSPKLGNKLPGAWGSEKNH